MGLVLRKEHTSTRSRNKSKTWYGLDDLATGFNQQRRKRATIAHMQKQPTTEKHSTTRERHCLSSFFPQSHMARGTRSIAWIVLTV